jgi:hypothetical protein
MRKLLTICALFGGLSGLGLAETWTGNLMDADCLHRHHASKTCDAKPSTTNYLLDVNGTQYRLDHKSSYDAKSAMQSRADKVSNPDATKAVPVQATVTGYVKKDGKIRANIIAVR